MFKKYSKDSLFYDLQKTPFYTALIYILIFTDENIKMVYVFE